MTARLRPEDRLYTPAEVAALFNVCPRTVWRWARAGKLVPVRTLGGQRRYKADEIDRMVNGSRP